MLGKVLKEPWFSHEETPESGGEGVKLEQKVLVTDNGIELLSTHPFEDDLPGKEV